MACDAKTYPINPAEAETVCAKIQSESGIFINPSKPTGTASTHGVTLSWTITNSAITINVVSKPFFISCSTIYSQLDSLFGV